MKEVELKPKNIFEVIRNMQNDWLEIKAGLYKLVGKEIKDCFLTNKGKCRESCALYIDGFCAFTLIAMRMIGLLEK